MRKKVTLRVAALAAATVLAAIALALLALREMAEALALLACGWTP